MRELSRLFALRLHSRAKSASPFNCDQHLLGVVTQLCHFRLAAGPQSIDNSSVMSVGINQRDMRSTDQLDGDGLANHAKAQHITDPQCKP